MLRAGFEGGGGTRGLHFGVYLHDERACRARELGTPAVHEILVLFHEQQTPGSSFQRVLQPRNLERARREEQMKLRVLRVIPDRVPQDGERIERARGVQEDLGEKERGMDMAGLDPERLPSGLLRVTETAVKESLARES